MIARRHTILNLLQSLIFIEGLLAISIPKILTVCHNWNL